MSGTDKDKPARVKMAQGARKPPGYIEQCAFWAGRPAAWQEAVKAQSGRDRASLRRACREALSADPEDVDIVPPPPSSTAWDVY